MDSENEAVLRKFYGLIFQQLLFDGHVQEEIGKLKEMKASILKRLEETNARTRRIEAETKYLKLAADYDRRITRRLEIKNALLRARLKAKK